MIAVARQGLTGLADKVNPIPDLGEYLTAVLVTVPLQLRAYHIALLEAADVDPPRNLAKSVTVDWPLVGPDRRDPVEPPPNL